LAWRQSVEAQGTPTHHGFSLLINVEFAWVEHQR